jgi:prepilin-type processing-associated H-X9-DG protein
MRHNNGANMVLADGHATPFRFPTTLVTDPDITSIKLPTWGYEYKRGTADAVAFVATQDMYSQGLQRNPSMTLEWSIPGVICDPP